MPPHTPSVAERRYKGDMLGRSVLVFIAALTTLPLRTAAIVRIPIPLRKSMVDNYATQRVQYGVEDTTGKYPYVVAVLARNKFRTCTGTLFAPKWVLAAAHCKSPAYVQYGNMTVPREDITSIREIIKVIQHPNYKSYKYIPTASVIYNDIGLMLIDNINLESVARLSALDYRTLYGCQVEFAGYGSTNRSNKPFLEHVNEPLQLGSGMIAPCHDVQMQLIFKPALCVAPQCAVRQSMLPGDSGGPVFVDGKVVGINVGIIYTSKISTCTPLSPYLEWIHKITSEE